MDTGESRQGAPPDAAARDEIDELFGEAFPNPERIGCPDDSVLVAIAAKQIDQDDPVFDHLEQCSPCFNRMRELRVTSAAAMPSVGSERHGPSSRRWLAIAAAVVLLLSGALLVWRLLPDGDAGRAPSPAVRLTAELDLRPYGASRGTGVEGKALELRRGVVELKMILPTGTEPGQYDIQLLDDGPGDLKSRTAASGTAAMRGYDNELRTTLDLSEVPPGRYQLALRYGTERWRMFPVDVR